MGFKSIPNVKFEEIDIEDNINFYRIVARLGEVGFLTPHEVFEAFDSGRMPTIEDSEEAQRKFKELKDKGLYQPIAASQPQEEGRPGGTTAPQTTKTVSPMGTNKASWKDLESVLKKQKAFRKSLTNKFIEQFGNLTKDQNEFIDKLASEIETNFDVSEWENKVNDTLNSTELETQQKKDIISLSYDLNLSVPAATLIYHAKKTS